MKKILCIGLLLMVGPAKAVVIDTTATWDGNVNGGWLGSGQSLTVDAVDTFFDDITFDFHSASNGRLYNFTLSDALNGGATLMSTTFTVVGGKGFIDVNTNLVAGSKVYALIDYNGYSGSTAHFQQNVYAGGESNFGADGSKSIFSGLDHVFVANFTGATVPAPAGLALFGLVLAGLGIRRQQTR